MKSLNEDLKTGRFAQIYLLYGEEAYLRKQYKDRLTRGMIPEGDTMNYAYFEGKNTDVKEIIDLAETMPFFGARRLIVLEDTGFFKNASPELADYIKEVPETTHFLFVEEEVDKRGKLFKAVKAKGRAVELGRQDEHTLVKWIQASVKREQKQMSDSAAQFLLNQVGTDMEQLQCELEKLFCYTLDRPVIEVADIREICTSQVTNHIFDMVNAVAEKKQKKALDYYYDLLALKEPPMRILYLMSRQFRLLLEVKELEQAGCAKAEIAAKSGLQPFLIGKYQSQARVFTKEELRGILETAAETEESVKTGRLADVMGVELFIVRYSRA